MNSLRTFAFNLRLLPGTHGFELVRLRGRVPDGEILGLAESSRAGIPGAKAGRPVKELARLVTDRLQAAFEAGGQGEAALGDSHDATHEADQPEPAVLPPDTLSPNALPDALSPPETDGTAGTDGPGVLEGNAEDAAEETAAALEVTAPDTPRAFVLDLCRAW